MLFTSRIVLPALRRSSAPSTAGGKTSAAQKRKAQEPKALGSATAVASKAETSGVKQRKAQ